MNITQLTLSAALLAVACSADDESSGATPDPVARGRYLVNNVAACVDCHTPRDPDTGAPVEEMFLAGVECFVQLDNGSCLNSRNLTSHETGLANRTDAEIERMIRDGIRPAATGDEALFPVMPYYVFHNLSEPDLDAVVAYLRTVPPVDHAVLRSVPDQHGAIAEFGDQ
jgi:mono/diheme cytochrome c family protein